MTRRRNHLLLQLQSDILEAVGVGRDLPDVADMLCRRVESLATDVICSILTVDERGCIHTLASPSLPPAFSAGVEGAAIGPAAGSCGTAAFRGEAVEVVDIAADPLWDEFRDLALEFGLRACWANPIRAEDGRVIGTFAFYYREPRGPSGLERRIVETCVHLCAIAIKRDEAQSRIHRLAYVDAVTGLPNRAGFEVFTSGSFADGTSVHYIDIDDFKAVNDTLGHRAGDLLLAEVGARLRRAVGGRGFVARLGGDEFVIVRPGPASDDGSDFARTVLAMFEARFLVDDQSLRIGASIGIAAAPRHGRDLPALSKRADIALYEAKSAGRGTYRVFCDEMETAIRIRRTLKQDLGLAMAERQLFLVFQPIVDLKSGALSSFEALLRWEHPDMGTIPPDSFIPIAEASGLIGELGLWVLGEATAAAAAWPDPVNLAVNVSALQLELPSFVRDVAAVLAGNGLPANRLDIEITETALLDRSASTRRVLGELRALGVGIALDDFGTGYSSLSYLRDRHFTKLKVDKSFVSDLDTSADCETIMRGILGVAREMGIRTTGEGIETQAQMDWLRRLGCDEGQGFHIGRPRREVAPFMAWARRQVAATA